jgi:hypothetical protein
MAMRGNRTNRRAGTCGQRIGVIRLFGMRRTMGLLGRYRPSPAMAVSVFALFIALGGTGYASSSLIGGSHGGHAKAQPSRRSGRSGVKSSTRLSRGKTGPTGPRGSQGPVGLTGPRGSQGPVGLTGPQGPTGETGVAGAQGITGSVGAQGLAGPMGPRGEQGSAGIQGAPGTARAYAFVEPGSTFCHCTPTTPLAMTHNVSLGSAAPSGTWCFVLDEGIDPSTAVVVASVEGASASLDSAQWVAGAPDCSANQVEIQTVRHTVQGGSLSTEASGEIPFSFVVP